MRVPLFLLFVYSHLCALAFAHAVEKPNILIFYIDDMGWGQPGCYGGKLAPTPNIDALAASGVRFTSGYVSAPVCSPSRAGLMTGRYQAHTGHDNLTQESRQESQMALTETTLAQRLKELGYVTGIVGKWHLGFDAQHLPASRGFDESVGSVGNLAEKGGFYRGVEKINTVEGAPVTAPYYTKEACSFIERHQAQPWMLYVPFNGVHSPWVASSSWLERFSGLKENTRYAAIIGETDDAVGKIVAKLAELQLTKNTLVFLISDNGGGMQIAEMGGLRGGKWFVWEGGIRVPWIVSWPGHIPKGKVLDDPVIQLDVMPTAIAAAGGTVSPDWKLDGVNLLPLLEGATDRLAARELYFRYGPQYAVRSGEWKLERVQKDGPVLLVNLSTDLGEATDLSEKFPEKKAELQSLYDKWNSTMIPPRWEDWRSNGTRTSKRGRNGNQITE